MLQATCGIERRRNEVLNTLQERLPVFVFFSNYFRVHPIIHLEHFATRIEQGLLDDDQYDFGNQCLLKLLGFTPRDLSNLGKVNEPEPSSQAAFRAYRDQLDRRSYQLNAASVRLTDEIRSVWNPKRRGGEADRLRISADGQYLKVAVEDDLGVEIELDQRSEGFQWLVSFLIVFFAEAGGKHKNAILLLDEPALSLHGLKQSEFRETLTRLARANQTIYTAHSPFLIGPDELDHVRIVELVDRRIGTKVHTLEDAEDPAALLPCRKLSATTLSQSLFSQQRSLLLKGSRSFGICRQRVSCLRQPGSQISTKGSNSFHAIALGSSSTTPPFCMPMHLTWQPSSRPTRRAKRLSKSSSRSTTRAQRNYPCS